MSFTFKKQSQAQSKITEEKDKLPTILSQDANKSVDEKLSKEIKSFINNNPMESATLVNEPKNNLPFYYFVLAGAVVLGVCGYIYISFDPFKTKKPDPNTSS